MPSIINDGPLFFANVVTQQEFLDRGILFGTDVSTNSGTIHWVVVDPGRFSIQVWQKPRTRDDFVRIGASLGASLFTNGPYVGHKFRTSIKFPEWSGIMAGGIVRYLVSGYNAAKRSVAARIYNFYPIGKLQGVARGVPRTGTNIQNLAHFGMSRPGNFRDYVMADGQAPSGLAEAISGLAWIVRQFNPETPLPPNRYCHWGLADFQQQNPPLVNPLAGQSQMQSAIRIYDTYRRQQYEENPFQPIPLSQAALSGVLFSCAYTGQPINTILAQILIKEAVSLDGSDSVLFGRGSTVMVGNNMSDEKRVGMHWGYCLFPRQ